MENIEQQLAKRAAMAAIEEPIIQAVRDSLPEGTVLNVESVEVVWLEPEKHSFVFIDDKWERLHSGSEVLDCFTVGGFEDLFTGFIILVPASELSHEDYKEVAGRRFWFNVISQNGMCMMPHKFIGLCAEFESGLTAEELSEQKREAIAELGDLFMQLAMMIAVDVNRSGRTEVIRQFNAHLESFGKPPMVVL